MSPSVILGVSLFVGIPLVIGFISSIYVLTRKKEKENVAILMSMIEIFLFILFIFNALTMYHNAQTVASAKTPNGLTPAFGGYYYFATLSLESNQNNICPYNTNTITTSNTMLFLLNLDNLSLDSCVNKVTIPSHNLTLLESIISGLDSIFDHNYKIDTTHSTLIDNLVNNGSIETMRLVLSVDVVENPKYKSLYATNSILGTLQFAVAITGWMTGMFVASEVEPKSVIILLPLGFVFLASPLLLGIPPSVTPVFNNITNQTHMNGMIVDKPINGQLSHVMGNRDVYVFYDTTNNIVYIGKDTNFSITPN